MQWNQKKKRNEEMLNTLVVGRGQKCVLYLTRARVFLLMVLHTPFPNCTTSLPLKIDTSFFFFN